MHQIMFATLIACSMLLSPRTGSADAIPVKIERGKDGWQLIRGGKPYFIRGAGGDASLQKLAAAGANSVRTWGADGLEARLDEAHALGLTVTVGIWLGHERHGFDYSDEAQVEEQLDRARQAVLRYKDHPSVLMWGVGNEMEGFAAGDNPAIWKAVNDVAAMVKKLDPHHPTMCVTAELGGARIARVREASAIDIHGINSYGGALSLAERYRAGGGTKPYVLTEFGPPGVWEIPKNDWGAPVEPTSTEKAVFYRRAYDEAVRGGAPGLALGSYVFVWGHKMEATATWYGMFLSDGARLGAVDVMTELWSGRAPSNLAPVVEPLVVQGTPQVDPGAELRVLAEVTDPEGGAVRVRWELRSESGEYNTGGDARPVPPKVEGALLESRGDGALVRMPRDPGPYRLFLYAYDADGGAATANAPLLVKGEVRTPMPFYVYQDGFENMPWAPSGWMGSVDALELNGQHRRDCHAGSACVEIRYSGELGWAGVAWQHPPNNWGDADGGFDLRGAKELELWARGAYGGERISMGVGLIESDKAHPDSAKRSSGDIVLTHEWRRYRIRLKRLDLSSIKTGFVITLHGKRVPVAVYLDEIRFVR